MQAPKMINGDVRILAWMQKHSQLSSQANKDYCECDKRCACCGKLKPLSYQMNQDTYSDISRR